MGCMEKQIRVGLIGFGLAGQVFHAPLIQSTSGMALTKIVTSRNEQVADKYPEVEVVQTVAELLDDARIDLVVIATPNASHYDYAKQAILMHKHVVVDKPFVLDSASANELDVLSRQHEVTLSVFHNRRWDNDFLTLQHVVAENTIGEVHTYQAHFHRYRAKPKDRWREQNQPGAGVLYDLGSHLIDQALVLFGAPDTVYADLLNQRGPHLIHAPDYFHLILGYEDKLRVYLTASSLAMQAGPRYEVHGEHGSFLKTGIDSQEEALKKGVLPDHPTWGLDQPEHYAKVIFADEERVIPTLRGRYEIYYEQVAKAIRKEAPVPVTAKEAALVIQVIERSIQSHAEKRLIYF